MSHDYGLRAWWWLIRKVGWRRAYAYWRHGQRYGWMTREQADRWFEAEFGVSLSPRVPAQEDSE